MPAPQKITARETIKDSTKLKATAEADPDMLQALIGEEGMMRAGAMPTISAQSAAGTKQLLDAVAKAIWAQNIVPFNDMLVNNCSTTMLPREPIHHWSAYRAGSLCEEEAAESIPQCLRGG